MTNKNKLNEMISEPSKNGINLGQFREKRKLSPLSEEDRKYELGYAIIDAFDSIEKDSHISQGVYYDANKDELVVKPYKMPNEDIMQFAVCVVDYIDKDFDKIEESRNEFCGFVWNYAIISAYNKLSRDIEMREEYLERVKSGEFDR